MRHYQNTFKENSYRHIKIKFYKVVARLSLLHSSETWITTKPGMTRLEAAEMRFLRSGKGYTRLRQSKKWNHKKRNKDPWNTNIRTKIGSTTLNEWITRDSRNTPSTTNTEDALVKMATLRCQNRSNVLIHWGRRRRQWSSQLLRRSSVSFIVIGCAVICGA